MRSVQDVSFCSHNQLCFHSTLNHPCFYCTHVCIPSGSGNGSLAGRTLAGALDAGGASLAGPGAGGGVGVGGRDGSIEATSSISSWGVMRSGATWAFGGGTDVAGSHKNCSRPM